MKKRVFALLIAVLMVLPLILTSCGKSDEEETAEDATLSRSTVWLTLYAITDPKTTPEAIAQVQEAVNRLTYVRYKTNLELRFYTADKYQQALDEAQAKFDKLAAAASSVQASVDASKKDLRAAQKSMSAEELRKAKQDERQAARESVRVSKAEEAARLKRIAEGIEEEITVTDPQMDIVFIPSFEDLLKVAEDKSMISLDKYLSENFTILSDYIQPAVMTGVANAGDGVTYAIPTNSLLTPDCSFMLFKKEYVDKYNIDLSQVVRLEDVTPILTEIKEKEPGIKPVEKPITILAETDFFGYDRSFISASNSEVEWLKKAVPGFGYATSLTISHFDLMSEWRQRGFFSLRDPYPEDGFQEIDDDVLLAPYPGDDEADWFMTVREASYYDKEALEEEGFYVIIYKSPEYTTENSLKTFYGISVNSRLPDRAMEILKMMNTESELKNLLQYGIREVHYSLRDDGVTITKLSDDYTMDFYATGNTFIGYIPEEQGADYVTKALELSKVAKINAFIGFDPRFTEEEQAIFDIASSVVKDRYDFLCQGLSFAAAYFGEIKTGVISALLQEGYEINLDEFKDDFSKRHTASLNRLIDISDKIRPTNTNEFDFISDKEAFDSSVSASRAEESDYYSVLGSIEASAAQSIADASSAAA